jgi:hypothetical protein
MREWHANAEMLAEKYKHATTAKDEVLGETGVEEHLVPNYDSPLWRVRVPVSRSAFYHHHTLTSDDITGR